MNSKKLRKILLNTIEGAGIRRAAFGELPSASCPPGRGSMVVTISDEC